MASEPADSEKAGTQSVITLLTTVFLGYHGIPNNDDAEGVNDVDSSNHTKYTPECGGN